MSVYQSSDGRFIYFDGATKHYFATESEATHAMSKITYAQQLQSAATQLAQTADRFEDLETIYFDRGYGSGGANEIQDEDISATGLTAGQVASLITLGQQLQNFRNNAAVAQGDYDATLNVARTDV